ncbi:hypothetical protein RUM44_006672 [Polyplax serrata]|uniref:Uncharacterized protein n=1 Tax=Polyplax serrata TaxID=468196 RepID=A0ABR1AKH3_POLSC
MRGGGVTLISGEENRVAPTHRENLTSAEKGKDLPPDTNSRLFQQQQQQHRTRREKEGIAEQSGVPGDLIAFHWKIKEITREPKSKSDEELGKDIQTVDVVEKKGILRVVSIISLPFHAWLHSVKLRNV